MIPNKVMNALTTTTRRRSRRVALASSGSRKVVVKHRAIVEMAHANAPSAAYKSSNIGASTADRPRQGSRTAKSVAPAVGGRDLKKLSTQGSAPSTAARLPSSGAKLAAGVNALNTTDSSATSSAPPIQNPQNPARRANHALTMPAESNAMNAAPMLIGSGCAIQGAASVGGNLPRKRSSTMDPAPRMAPRMRFKSAPVAPHSACRPSNARRRNNRTDSANKQPSTVSAAGSASRAGQATTARAKTSK